MENEILASLNDPTISDTGWIDLIDAGILDAAFTNFDQTKYGRAQVRKKDGRVYMRGLIKLVSGANIANNTKVMTLPQSMTPLYEHRLAGQNSFLRIGDRTLGTPGTAGYAYGLVYSEQVVASSFITLDNVQYFVD